MPDQREFEISRRDLLAAAAIGLGGLTVAGCGGSNKTSSGTTGGGGVPKRGGTFRFGTIDGSTADSLDPLQGDNTYTNIAICAALFDTLTRYNDKTGDEMLWLAESLEPAPDVSYWTVRLRPAEFHNGKPVTADDVIYSLRRTLAPKSGAFAATILASVDPQRLQKLDSRTVRVNLHYPDVGLPYGLRNAGFSIVPVGFDAKHPIGSGPFKFGSISPGQQSTYVRNENYWRSGQPYLDELQIVDFADPGTTRVNALTTGQIDGANQLPLSFAPEVQRASNLKVIVSESASSVTWEMKMDAPPFDDVRVRQAMRLIANRPQIVEQAYNGPRFARIANDWGAIDDPLYDHSIPQRTQDIAQAKSLLKQAGREGMTVELVVSNVTSGVVETAQVLAQQAAAAGITIKINNVSDSATYFSKYQAQAPFKFNYNSTLSTWEYLGFDLLPGAPSGVSYWHDPQWLKLVTQARGTLDFAKRKQLMSEAQRIFWDRGTQGIFAFFNTLDAYSSKFTRFHPSASGRGLNGVHFEDVSEA